MSKERIIVGIASIPEREESLKEACESLYDQVDEIHIFCNGYGEDYKLPFIGRKKKYHVYYSENFEDKGDAGKFFYAEKADGYFLSCDDDLIYPEDYAEKMVEAIERHGRNAIVSFHGRKLFGKVKSYYGNSTCVAHCLDNVSADTKVHIGGTGVMGYHTSLMSLDWSAFSFPNMADVFIAVSAQQNRIPIIAAKHNGGWIKHSEKVDLSKTIYEQSRNNDKIQTALIQIIKYWKLY